MTGLWIALGMSCVAVVVCIRLLDRRTGGPIPWRCRLGRHPKSARWSGQSVAGCHICGHLWNRRRSDPDPIEPIETP